MAKFKIMKGEPVGGEPVTPNFLSKTDNFVRFGTDTRDGLTRAGYRSFEPVFPVTQSLKTPEGCRALRSTKPVRL